MITILQKGYMDYSVAMLNLTKIYNLEIKRTYKEICENFCLLGRAVGFEPFCHTLLL